VIYLRTHTGRNKRDTDVTYTYCFLMFATCNYLPRGRHLCDRPLCCSPGARLCVKFPHRCFQLLLRSTHDKVVVATSMPRPAASSPRVVFIIWPWRLFWTCSKQSAKIQFRQVLNSYQHPPNTSTTYIPECVKTSTRFANLFGRTEIYLQVGIGVTAPSQSKLGPIFDGNNDHTKSINL
jgi:hypothetical protein